MRGAKAVLVEALGMALAGSLLALAANALSPAGLSLTRNYFPRLPDDPAPTPATNPVQVTTLPTTNVASATSATTAVVTTNVPAPVPTGGVPAEVLLRLQKHGLQVVMSNDVTRLFRDPRYEQGVVVFVDARDDAHYTAGHIPGAHQFNHYRPEQYLPTVLPACLQALQIVVYCTGGQCEDSEFAAIMLRDAGIPKDNLFVYPGGINEWTALQQPIELGARRSGQIKP